MFQSHKTITGRKRFKRYFTGHDNGKPGKGSWRRDTEVAEEQFANNWCQTFGHRWFEAVCKTCGITRQEAFNPRKGVASGT